MMLRLKRNNLRYPIVKPMSRDSMQRGKHVSISCFFVMAGLFASPACGGGRRARRSAASGGSHHAHRILVGHPHPGPPPQRAGEGEARVLKTTAAVLPPGAVWAPRAAVPSVRVADSTFPVPLLAS